MSAATLTTPKKPALPPATGPVWGEVVTWSCAGVRVSHKDLVAALSATGLDPAVARRLAPRHAWARACKKLEEGRIIRRLAGEEGATEVRFQLTAERESAGRYEYTPEAFVTLDTVTGGLACADAALLARAQALLDECVEARTGSDVTRVIQRLFEKNADLFPVRDQGGVYFVADAHAAFTDRVARLVRALGGTVRRFPVPKGNAEGDASVRDAVLRGLQAVVEEQRKAVEAWDEETRQGTVDRAVNRFVAAREKAAAYAEYLGSQRAALEAEIAAAEGGLREKVLAIGRDAPAG